MSKKNSKKTTKTTRTKTTTTSKGLGDTVEKITKATGIKAVVDAFADATGLDCGCDARKEKLNKLFPYKRAEVLCLEESEYKVLDEFFASFNGNEIKLEYQKPLSSIHARVFQHKMYVPCSCAPREWQNHINDLRGIYEAYETE
jgi:hypothetical protein